MNLQIKLLVNLQKNDLEIGDFKKRLKTLPEQIETSRSCLAKEKEQLDRLKKEIEAMQKKRIQLEHDAEAANDLMRKTRTKLPAVKTNKEYSAILAEAEAAKKKIALFEDEELEIMEALEEKEKDIPRLENLYKHEEQKFQEFKKQKDGEIVRVEQDLKASQMERGKILPLIEDQWARHYEKVAKSRGEHVVVPLQESTCQGCNQQVLPQLAIDVKIGEKVLQCVRCYRFLYWEEMPEAETVVPK